MVATWHKQLPTAHYVNRLIPFQNLIYMTNYVAYLNVFFQNYQNHCPTSGTTRAIKKATHSTHKHLANLKIKPL